MDANPSSTSQIKRYKQYFTPVQVEALSAKQRGKMSVSRAERQTQQACDLIDLVGGRIGFPRRTIATAQSLFHRFHLFFPFKDFRYHEMALATLYVSAKLHDTLKKPRDIILASYVFRHPRFVKKGSVDPASVDAKMLESDRKKLLSIERLVLETICFSFWAGVDVAFGDVVKIGRKLGASQEFCQLAWRVAIDSYRTPAPLSYPPHVLAVASLYTTALLHIGPARDEDDAAAKDAAALLSRFKESKTWETDFKASGDTVEDVTHHLLDLYHLLLTIPANDQSMSHSPASPASPTSNPSASKSPSALASPAYVPSSAWTPQALTQLKIELRERRSASNAASTLVQGEGLDLEGLAEGMGKNEGTIRFLWASHEVV